MRRTRLWLTSLVLAAACSAGQGAKEEGVAAPEVGWPMIARTLTGPIDATSPNVCNRGDAPCLDVLVDEMTKRLDRLAASCDHAAPFALSYLMVTDGLRGATASADPAIAVYLRHLDALFGRLFFEASDAWAAGRTAAVPSAWRRAFDAGSRRQVTGLGDLLAGMNAHITRDLAFATAVAGLTLSDGRSAKPAFDQVNLVLASLQQPMVAELARRFDPTFAQIDLSRIVPASSTISQLLVTWRDEAWISASRLAAASPADRPAVEASIEASADARGLAIVVASQYVPFLTSTASRDQYCRVNGRR